MMNIDMACEAFRKILEEQQEMEMVEQYMIELITLLHAQQIKQ